MMPLKALFELLSEMLGALFVIIVIIHHCSCVMGGSCHIMGHCVLLPSIVGVTSTFK